MNIHIIENEKFTPLFLEMLNNYFPKNSNKVYIHQAKNYDFVKNRYSFVTTIDSFDEVDLTLVSQPLDKIFIHAFYNQKLLKFLFLNKYKLDFRKVVFIAWGADIYNSNYRLQEPVVGLRDVYQRLRIRFYEKIKRILMKKVHLYMTFACDDINIINGYYRANGIQFDCLYPSTVNLEDLNKIKKSRKINNNVEKNGIATLPTAYGSYPPQSQKRQLPQSETFGEHRLENRCVTILLGNSATKTNQHKQMLDILAKFKNETISIICPLSYGDKEYAVKIKDYGLELFGDKFVPLMEYMSPVKYANILGKVDIAVFNHNRQQATGNIEILAYLGKKIFIRSDISSWNHYVVRDKCTFFDTKKIEGMSFEEFIDNPLEAIETNEKYFLKIWDINHVVSLWKKIMNYEV